VNDTVNGNYKLLYFQLDERERVVKVYDPMKDGTDVLDLYDERIVKVINYQDVLVACVLLACCGQIS
jgi:hypothetical protein